MHICNHHQNQRLTVVRWAITENQGDWIVMAEEPMFGPKTLKHTEQPAPAEKQSAPAAAKLQSVPDQPTFGAQAFNTSGQPIAGATTTAEQDAHSANAPQFGASAHPAAALDAETVKASQASSFRHGVAQVIHQTNQFLNRGGFVFWLKYYALAYLAFRLFAFRFLLPGPILQWIGSMSITRFIWGLPSWYIIMCLVCYPIFVWGIREMAPDSTRMSVEILFGLPSVRGELDPRYWALRSLLFMIKFILSGVAVVIVVICAIGYGLGS